MRVFVTGASGWIGSASVDELIAGGHEVVGLARSDGSAAALEAKGATVLRGDLDDLDALRRGARESEGVVHLANKHDWANPAESNRAERVAVETLAGELVGSDRPLLVASGVAMLAEGRPGTEDDPSRNVGPDSPRGGSENRAFDFVDQGVRAVAVRFAPTTHGDGDHGFVSLITAAARTHGVSAYVDDGVTTWSAVHRSDAARLVRLALEGAPAGSRVHAVAEESIPSRAIAEAIGAALDVPVTSVARDDAIEHFGFIGGFFGMDLSASSALTRERFDWRPTGPTLLEDIAAGAYTRDRAGV
ncbi:SDR family oxidoreductase [Pseudonocardia endophytica]|uniref:Nucleoside-diphosphate-sugar epimerase n=1 Tax=Pseudonocardia endophytica TaxID=401976 RepID=A0A4R1HUS0_PSEEN|nr:SDR family oxidoreductase [Pseudonocardia endophytica]TCK24715.1 nucleoside-diphosphate-sugar epimerase [Pseudonocardia endophytica]